MAGEYKALRVPIALLQQKVYPQGRRLAGFVPLVPEKPKIEIDHSRVISPGATGVHFVPRINAALAGHLKTDTSLFTRMPYLRRFFFRVGNGEWLKCRGCGELAKTEAERAQHPECQKAVSKVLRKIMSDKSCVVCDKRITNPYETSGGTWGIPICCDACLQMWDFFNPEAFRFELGAMQGQFGSNIISSLREDPQRAGDIIEGLAE